MGGGKDRKASQQRQEGLSRTQEELGRYFMDQSKQDLAQRRQLLDPVISRYSKLASGDPTQIGMAAAPEIANLEQQARQARANIMEMAPGAARNAALGMTERDLAARRSAILNQSYLSAFPALQGLASESGSTGLQAAGAGYSGIGAAASTNKDVMLAQQQEKASQLGLIGSLAGVAGTAVGSGGMLGNIFKRGTSGVAGTATNAVTPSLAGRMSSFIPSISMPINPTYNLPSSYSNPLNYQQAPPNPRSFLNYMGQ